MHALTLSDTSSLQDCWYNHCMNTYTFTLEVKVEVEAYNEADAEDAVQDVFGRGEDCGITVTDLKITEK